MVLPSSQIFAPEDGESNSDTLASYILFQVSLALGALPHDAMRLTREHLSPS